MMHTTPLGVVALRMPETHRGDPTRRRIHCRKPGIRRGKCQGGAWAIYTCICKLTKKEFATFIKVERPINLIHYVFRLGNLMPCSDQTWDAEKIVRVPAQRERH